MSPEPEEHLQEAVQLHQTSKFDKCIKAAEKARKKFQKSGQIARATEALRVMADCTINALNLKKAHKLYEELLRDGIKIDNYWYQSAAQWGLGQVSLRKMDYSSAAGSFEKGLYLARKIPDKWYIAWNAFGLANALRGMNRIDEARTLLQESIGAYRELGQDMYVSWAEHALSEIGGELHPEPSSDVRVWLCPMCGSSFNLELAVNLRSGKMVTCEYCGTSVG
ncbi:MAG: tetratricopeptide repeat protein [Candidatus Hodarchaeota archaeon]